MFAICKERTQRCSSDNTELKKSPSTSAHLDVNLRHNLALLGKRMGLFHSWFSSKPRDFPLSWSLQLHFRRYCHRKWPQQSSQMIYGMFKSDTSHSRYALMQICLSRVCASKFIHMHCNKASYPSRSFENMRDTYPIFIHWSMYSRSKRYYISWLQLQGPPALLRNFLNH